MIIELTKFCVYILIFILFVVVNPSIMIDRYKTKDKCTYKMFEHEESVNSFYGCAKTDLEIKNIWRSNIRLLSKHFDASSRYQSVPFDYKISYYKYTGAKMDRYNLFLEVRSLINIYLTAASASSMATMYAPETKDVAGSWERRLLLQAIWMENVLLTSFPNATNEDLDWISNENNKTWDILYLSSIRSVQDIIIEQYEYLRKYVNVCDLEINDDFQVAISDLRF